MSVYLGGKLCLRDDRQAAFTLFARVYTVGGKISPGGIRIADRVREAREERPKRHRSLTATTQFCWLNPLTIHTGVNHKEIVRARLPLLGTARQTLRSPHRAVLKYRAIVSTDYQEYRAEQLVHVLLKGKFTAADKLDVLQQLEVIVAENTDHGSNCDRFASCMIGDAMGSSFSNVADQTFVHPTTGIVGG